MPEATPLPAHELEGSDDEAHVPADLLELHEVLEWGAALAAAPAEEGDDL